MNVFQSKGNPAQEITVVILTLNEAAHIQACIRSARLVSERIMVLDSYSEDDTRALAREEGAIVLSRRFDTYPNQRNAALASVTTPWTFFLDADERVTPQLAGEIHRAVTDPRYVGWWVPRRNIIVGKWIRGGGWYPDYQLRLMRTDKARYDPARAVHEVVHLDGEAGYLSHPLVHYNYDSWDEFRTKQRRYARFDVQVLRQQGIRPKPYSFLTMPAREFWRRFVTLRGYVDGIHGVRLALYMAWYTLHVYRLLGQKTKRNEVNT